MKNLYDENFDVATLFIDGVKYTYGFEDDELTPEPNDFKYKNAILKVAKELKNQIIDELEMDAKKTKKKEMTSDDLFEEKVLQVLNKYFNKGEQI